jgi:hypothetical protein
MTRKVLLLFAMVACSAASSAMAATFTAKAEGNTVTVYESSEKPEHCKMVAVKFTILKDGKRADSWSKQEGITTKPGRNIELFHITDPLIVAPLIDGDVIADCQD